MQTYMLVDKNNADILSFFCKSCECLLNLGVLGFLVHDKEVPLRVGWLGDMTNTCKKKTCDGALDKSDLA